MPDVIVFDMDNTLVDEWGATLRPGMVSLLTRLRNDRWQLVLWTNSRAERARDILRHHDLRHYFDHCLYREDYDPDNSGNRKDIRMVGGRLLIDDDPREIEYVRGLGLAALAVQPYRRGHDLPADELLHLYTAIHNHRSWQWQRWWRKWRGQ